VISYLKAFYYWTKVSFGEPSDRPKNVFLVLKSLPDDSHEVSFVRYMRECGGCRLVGRQLSEILRDTEFLSTLPDGSFGRAYLDFVSSKEVDMGKFLSATAVLRRPDMTELEKAFHSRQNETHDLIHVLFGYSRSNFGECMTLITQAWQMRIRGFKFIVYVGLVRWMITMPWAIYPVYRALKEGHRRQEKAGWLMGYDWEAMLSKDLSELRVECNISERPRWYRFCEKGTKK
jgi:ubiquinone biosynthesis protein COQ4